MAVKGTILGDILGSPYENISPEITRQYHYWDRIYDTQTIP